MKYVYLLLSLWICLSSFTRLDFNQIMLGTSLREVVDFYGDPYAVLELEDGGIAFEYIERISMNNELVYVNHYYLTFINDRVVSKSFREENRPAFDQMYQQNPNYPTYP